ncbi:ribosomal RNA small subunit methyltransferase, mitochondrial [Neltuma alba]|uniref:ribosomal RNA small subunit methyltransferase, mitochondrial n=1 Tax=Neltuma alba TaxID=207710 RepID=UPI0010A57513|nr:ribosomal RNA small subunit methyltransferase, mitochondrial [Prosopis alba]
MLRTLRYFRGCNPRLRLLRQLYTMHGHRCYPNSKQGRDDEGHGARKHYRDDKGNIFFYKSRGQHILTNPRILDTIVRKSAIKPTDTVLEIGPGTGNLTLKLLEAAQKVVAIEIDERMVEVLDQRVAERGFSDRLLVIRKDALRTEFPQFDLVVANIPYGISSPLVIKLVYGNTRFRSATLLLQKEFARRLLANPGDSEFNRLAVNVKLVADVEFIMDVSKRDFLPCPKVDSSVVIIRPKAEVLDVDISEWRAFTRTCFNKKNKTLGATFKQKRKIMELLRLSNITGLSNEKFAHSIEGDCSSETGDEAECHYSHSSEGTSLLKERIAGVLQTGGFEDKRPSKLSLEEFVHLLSLFNRAGIFFHDRENLRNEDSLAADVD